MLRTLESQVAFAKPNPLRQGVRFATDDSGTVPRQATGDAAAAAGSAEELHFFVVIQ
jgi:hypothetical protein